ncbi:hypothetical protein AKJ09_01836 [Labilithrix luteola]|uniref:Uncharacterized protein n=1 Tax=Labilithrix luteola TaxID=1391654 RepID=A0A0K1PNS9_9BACT|nr:hypothetical protein [Labilithrix luteola]AKU95172.1 hypothetical protein AKJ09_01836 [Labilithrix luteola]
MTSPPSPNPSEEESPEEAERAAEELLQFFRTLPTVARRAYEALAEADRTYGEDVGAQKRAAGAAKGVE